MNTSTKILLGLIIAVIVVPILLAMSLKNKEKNKEFTTGSYGHMSTETLQKGQFGPYKSIQITGPDAEAFSCVIRKSDQSRYEYSQFENEDSVSVFLEGDTLFVNYVAYVDKNKTGNRRPGDIELKLFVPAIENISINGARVIIDSTITLDNVMLKLKNKGSLRSAKLGVDDDTSMNGPVSEGKETVLNLEEKTDKSPAVSQPASLSEKEVKDEVIFHLM